MDKLLTIAGISGEKMNRDIKVRKKRRVRNKMFHTILRKGSGTGHVLSITILFKVLNPLGSVDGTP